MTSKERLQDIKQTFAEEGYINLLNIQWLLKQAEKSIKYEEVLKDFSLNGTKRDTNPTLSFDGNEIFTLLKYIQSMDDYVRDTAQRALDKFKE